MSFQTHTTLELRSCFDISHEIKPQSRPLQTDFNSLAMTSWSRFLSCALKAAESENTEYLNIYWHTQRPYRPLYPPPPLTYCQCSVDLCYPVRFCYLPLKQKVVQCQDTGLINDLLHDLIMVTYCGVSKEKACTFPFDISSLTRSFTCPHVIPNLCDCIFSVKHKMLEIVWVTLFHAVTMNGNRKVQKSSCVNDIWFRNELFWIFSVNLSMQFTKPVL